MTLSSGGPSDHGRLSLILNGKYEPAVCEVLQLAELLGKDISEILKRFGYKVPRAR